MNPSELIKGCHSFLYDDGQEKVYCGGIDVFAHIPVYCNKCKARMKQALFDYKKELKFNSEALKDIDTYTINPIYFARIVNRNCYLEDSRTILKKALNIHTASVNNDIALEFTEVDNNQEVKE